MAERGGANEWQPEYIGADIGQGRHAETGRERAGDDRKLAVRISADFVAVAFDIAPGIFQIGLGQTRFSVEVGREVGAQPQRRRAGFGILGQQLFPYAPGSGHQINAIGQLGKLKGRPVASVVAFR